MKYFFYKIWERILIIWNWLPIIFTDNDWDYHDIYTVLRHKLERTANYIERKKRFEGWEFVVRDIRLCVKLIDLIGDGYYETEYQNYTKQDFIYTPLKDKEGYELTINTKWEKFDEYFAQNKLIHKKVLKYLAENSEKFTDIKSKNLQALQISQFKHRKAKKLLFKIMDGKISHWWD